MSRITKTMQLGHPVIPALARAFMLLLSLAVSSTATAGEITLWTSPSSPIMAGSESAANREVRFFRIDQKAAVQAAIDANAPERIEEVRSTGRHILAARKRQTEGEDVKELREKIDALRKALLSMQDISVRSVSSGPVVPPDSKTLPSPEAPAMIGADRMEKARKDVFASVNHLKKTRVAVTSLSDEHPTRRESSIKETNKKLEALEMEIETMLQNPEQPKPEKLAELVRRLTIHRPVVKPDFSHPTTRQLHAADKSKELER